jgi:aminoglycoside 3-N-acetyltransferase
MVHSAYDQFEGFQGTPADVLRILRDAVGSEGALMMPTIPFSGSAHDWVAQRKIMDVSRTPSFMGLLTELFRRQPDVLRSAHPTHPVAVWGSRSEAIIADNYLAQTPCGSGTPFGRLLEMRGKTLLLGTTIESMTFYHFVEEVLEPQMPFSPFTKETYTLQTKDRDGRLLTSELRLMDRHYSSRRHVGLLTPVLQQAGQWHEARIGNLTAILLDAKEVLDACQLMASQGKYCYDA